MVRSSLRALMLTAATTLFLVTAPGPVTAQTLQQAIRQALTESPKLGAERERQRADREKLPQARAGMLPTVTARGGYGPGNERSSTTGASTGTTMTGNVGLTISQPVFDGLKTINDINRARAEVEAGREGLAAAQADLIVAVAEAYMAVLRDRQIVRLRTDNLSILRGQVSSAAARQAAGDLSRTAVAQARTRAAEAEADLADARASLAESEAAWRATIGTGPIAPSLPGSLARMLPRSLEMALAQAETANPNVRSAALVARAAQFGVGVARGAMFPRVSVDGDYSTDLGRTLRSNETEAASVMVRLSIPLMDGGAGASRVRQARATSNQRSLEAADTRLMVRRAVAGAWAALDGARLRKAASGRRIAAAQAAVAGLNAEFASGMIAFSDLLDSRRELVNARIASVIADYDEVVAAFMLMAAAGTLSERMLDAAPERPVVATGSVGRPAPAAAVPARSAAAPQPARPVETASRPEPRRAASDPWAKIVPGQ